MSKALSRKWRPARFDQVIGQDHVTHTLQNSVIAGRIGHAYLFCGPRGTGKTTMARLLAKAVNCQAEDPSARPDDSCPSCLAINEARFLDLIEIDAASNTGVDDIRNLRDKVNFAPSQGRYKVYIIDEVHMLSTAAFNALLKTLEEPPAHTIFVLATTEEHKVPLTIKSRCQQFNFRLLTTMELAARLKWLAEQEGLAIEPQVIDLIARQAAGSVRDAESLLDQLVISPDAQITLSRAQMVLGTAADEAVLSLTDAWINGDGAGGLQIIHNALRSGADARQFSRQIVAHLRQLLLLQAAGGKLDIEGPVERKKVMTGQAQRANRRSLIEATRRFQEAAMQPTSSWQPQLPLELAFMELLPDEPMPHIRVGSPAPTPAYEPVDESAVRTAPAFQANLPETQPQTEDPEPLPSEPAAAAPAAKQTPPPTAAAGKPKPQKEQPVDTVAASPATGPAKALTLVAVSGMWPEMTQLAGRRNKNLPALLAMCKPLAIEGYTIVLGFDYPLLREKFDKTAGAAATVTDAFRALTQQECTIRTVVTPDFTVPVNIDEFQALADELGGVITED